MIRNLPFSVTAKPVVKSMEARVYNIADSVWLVRDGQVVGEEKVAARGKVI